MFKIETDVKKIKILLLAAALLCGAMASAQTQWNAGMGYASTSVHGEDASAFLTDLSLNGFYAGVSHEFYFSALAGLTFEPGLFFYYQSGRNAEGAKPKYIKMHSLSLPLNIKYSFELAGGVTGSFFTGPVANVGLVGKLYEDGAFVTNTDLTDPMHALSRMSLQWNVGAAATFAQAIQLRVGYAFGLSRLIPEEALHSNVFTVGLGFLF